MVRLLRALTWLALLALVVAGTAPRAGEGDRKDPFKTDCFGKDARASAVERVTVEEKVWGKKAPVVAYSRHFYVVTDVTKIQVKTQSGGLRWVEAHEYAHIMLERAEKA